MSIKRLPKKKRKEGHFELMGFIADNELECRLSGHAQSALIANVVTISEFFSFSVEDYMEFNGVGKKTATELVIRAEEFRNIGNDKKIKKDIDALNMSVACAHEEGLSDILRPFSKIHHKEAFNKIFNILKSLFGIRDPFISVYSYLSSIRHGDTLYVCPNAGEYIPNKSRPYYMYILGTHEGEVDVNMLNCFDEAFLKSCITFIGHNLEEESYMHMAIVNALEELQENHNVLSFLSSEGRDVFYQLKYGRIPAFARFNSSNLEERLSDREYRILFKSVIQNKSYEEIGVEEGLTRGRVQQINKQTIDNLRFLAQEDGSMEIIRSYRYDEYAYLTPYNSNFYEIRAREPIDYNFDFFCFIISIMYDDVFTIYRRNKIQQGETSIITYLCNRKITNVLDIVKIQNYIQKIYHKLHTKEIALNPILDKREFWLVNKVDEETINSIKGLLIYICQEGFDLIVSDADKPFVDVSEFQTHEKIAEVISEILSQKGGPMSPEMILSAMVQYNSDAYDFLSVSQLKSFLSINKALFTQIGVKSLYTLATSQNYAGSVNKSIGKTLWDSPEPLKMQELIQKVLQLRPDSNEKSVRSVITSMIKKNECTLYKDSYVGLTSRVDDYSAEFEPDESVSKFSFSDRIQALYSFLDQYHRMPNMQGDAKERSLCTWYRRIIDIPDLSVDKLVILDKVEQICRDNHYPKDVHECDFRDNCEQVKAIILRTGKLPQMYENKKICEWLYRAAKREQNLSLYCREEYESLKQFIRDFDLDV